MRFWSQRTVLYILLIAPNIASSRKLISTLSLRGFFFSPFPFEHRISNSWAFPETTQQSRQHIAPQQEREHRKMALD